VGRGDYIPAGGGSGDAEDNGYKMKSLDPMR